MPDQERLVELSTENTNVPMTTFQGAVTGLRVEVKMIAARLNLLKMHHGGSERTQVEDRGEVMANLTLAYRHLEDASMRLGKTIQAFDGGVSVYDKSSTVGATNGGSVAG